jgi:hypothetical protein
MELNIQHEHQRMIQAAESLKTIANKVSIDLQRTLGGDAKTIHQYAMVAAESFTADKSKQVLAQEGIIKTLTDALSKILDRIIAYIKKFFDWLFSVPPTQSSNASNNSTGANGKKAANTASNVKKAPDTHRQNSKNMAAAVRAAVKGNRDIEYTIEPNLSVTEAEKLATWVLLRPTQVQSWISTIAHLDSFEDYIVDLSSIANDCLSNDVAILDKAKAAITRISLELSIAVSVLTQNLMPLINGVSRLPVTALNVNDLEKNDDQVVTLLIGICETDFAQVCPEDSSIAYIKKLEKLNIKLKSTTDLSLVNQVSEIFQMITTTANNLILINHFTLNLIYACSSASKFYVNEAIEAIRLYRVKNNVDLTQAERINFENLYKEIRTYRQRLIESKGISKLDLDDYLED